MQEKHVPKPTPTLPSKEVIEAVKIGTTTPRFSAAEKAKAKCAKLSYDMKLKSARLVAQQEAFVS